MFIYSFKADKKKISVILAVILLLITLGIILSKQRDSSPKAECDGMKYSLNASTNEERVAFLSQFGWKVNPEPAEIKEVIIPEKFNDVYDNYNVIQKDQGLDLLPYAGKTCRQWVYNVTNYPQGTEVRATLLIYGNIVIGGDLSTTAMDGFMTGFKGEQMSADDNVGLISAASEESKSAPDNKAAPDNKSQESKAAPKDKSAPEKKGAASSAIPTNAWPTD